PPPHTYLLLVLAAAPTDSCPLSLHDALPILLAQADARVLFSSLLPASAVAAVVVIGLYALVARFVWKRDIGEITIGALSAGQVKDRKSTRLNSSHVKNSYAVFCLKKKITH